MYAMEFKRNLWNTVSLKEMKLSVLSFITFNQMDTNYI